jgi:hypothetical protein
MDASHVGVEKKSTNGNKLQKKESRPYSIGVLNEVQPNLEEVVMT